MPNSSLKKVVLFCTLLFTSTFLFAQNTSTISGKVADLNGTALLQATITAKGSKQSTTTKQDGSFTLTNVPAKGTLIISYVGFVSKQISYTEGTDLMVQLTPAVQDAEEVIVTGVFDKRKRNESSIAISTLDAKKIDRLTPISAADLLKNVPSVFVNSSAGEVRNIVYSRGVSANSVASVTQNTNGYYYVSLQEDGLPVIAASSGLVTADFFLRSDITTKRLEAVRGGSSSITGVNAPGGIFNFLSKTGGLANDNEVRLKFGLEGDGKNPFYRTDINTGGVFKDKSIFYNIGGFYRTAQGARYAGYALNNGGQVKANITKNYNKGSIRFFVKYLNDKNGFALPTPAQGFSKITLAPGVGKADSYLLPKGNIKIPNGSETNLVDFDPAKTNQAKEFNIGFNLKQSLGNNFVITNNGKYSTKSVLSNTNAATSFSYLTDPTTYVFAGILGGPGSVALPGVATFKERETGKVVAQVRQSFGPTGPSYTILNTDLPNGVKDALLYQGSLLSQTDINEVMDQFTVTKTLKNGSVNFGAFYDYSTIKSNPNMPAAVLALSLIKDRPTPLDITFDAVTNQKFQVSDPNSGYLKYGGSFGFGTFDYKQNQLAFFAGHNFTFSKKFNVDYGVRYENLQVKGTNLRSTPTRKVGGIDGSTATIFDNFYGVIGNNNISFKKAVNSFSYSAGINYKINEKNTTYFRVSKGQKSPDLDFYNTYTSQFAADNNPPQNQDITQLELSYKFRNDKIKFAITPFYSKLSNVGVTALAADSNSQFYFTPTLYNTVETKGVEIEFDYTIVKNFSLAGAITLQNAKYKKWQTWSTGVDGKADDKIVDYTGNKAENNPDALITLTPTYATNKFYALVQFKYLGDRPVNQANAYELPAFSQFDFGAGYNFTKKLSLSVNINNFTNVLGIMGSLSPGSIIQAFNPQNITKADVAANPNAVHTVVPIQPRAYFLTATYKF